MLKKQTFTDTAGRKPSLVTTAWRGLGRRARRGSAYVLVLAAAMFVSVVGVTSITLARINTSVTSRSNDWVEAQALAFSAVEHALSTLNGDSNWRTTYQHNVSIASKQLDRGAFTWKLLDTTDTDLADSPTDPFVIIATATVGDASYSLKVEVSITGSNALMPATASWQRVVE